MSSRRSLLSLLAITAVAVQLPVTVHGLETAPAVAQSFVRWSHPTGLMSADVPAGWNIDGQFGDALDQGQFRINAFSPDRLSFVSFGHNWLSFMEFQYGPYRPGAATVESIVLPDFLRSQPGYVGAG